MVKTVKLIAIGSAVGIVLPPEILQRLRVREGDSLYLLETPGGIELTPCHPEFIAQMEMAEQVMREDRNALKKLAE